MKDDFQGALAALEVLENPETLESRAAKTAETTTTQHSTDDDLHEASPDRGEKLETAKLPTAKTAKTSEADQLGLVATWSAEFGYVSIHDPVEGVWWDLQVKTAPDWALSEARKRKELYRDGNRKAYRLTSREMEEIWEAEHPDLEAGIVEDHPLEEKD